MSQLMLSNFPDFYIREGYPHFLANSSPAPSITINHLLANSLYCKREMTVLWVNGNCEIDDMEPSVTNTIGCQLSKWIISRFSFLYF